MNKVLERHDKNLLQRQNSIEHMQKLASQLSDNEITLKEESKTEKEEGEQDQNEGPSTMAIEKTFTKEKVEEEVAKQCFYFQQ